jgi:hypothetical protein
MPRRQESEVVGDFHGRPTECGGCGASTRERSLRGAADE